MTNNNSRVAFMRNKIARLSIALVFALVSLGAEAVVCTTQGTGNWSSAGIWDCGHVPNAGDTVVIANNITLDRDYTVAGLTISSGVTLTATNNDDLTVTGNIVNNGTYTSNGERLFMTGAGATISGTGTFNNTRLYIDSTNITLTAGSTMNFSGGANIRVGSNNAGSLSIAGTITDIGQPAGSRILRLDNNNPSSVTITGALNTPNSFVEIQDGGALTNNGTVNIQYLDGNGGIGATWTQGPNSSLTMSAPAQGWVGTFNADATGNTVTYNGTATPLTPSNNTYYNLAGTYFDAPGSCPHGFVILGSSPCPIVPMVLSITRNDPDPTGAQSVSWTVTFSTDVTGVDMTDFSLVQGVSVTGATITGVTGSAITWVVTADTGSGSGTLRLDLVDDDSIIQGDGTPLGGTGLGNGDYTAGEFYTIAKFRNIDFVTLNGATTVTVAPGAAITALIQVTTSGGRNDNDWLATGWLISTTPPGAITCVDHPDHTRTGTYTETFPITAPTTPGVYHAYFIAYIDNACTQGASGTFTMTDAVTIVVPPPPVSAAYYAMDESDWALGVADSSGNNNTGTALGAAAPTGLPVPIPPDSARPGTPGTCGTGNIPDSGATDGVDTGIDLNNFGNAGSIAFWYSSNTPWNDGVDRMLFDASNDAAILGILPADKHFYLIKEGGGRLRFALENSLDTNYESRSPALNYPANEWHHIVVTWDIGVDRARLYIDGVLVVRSNNTSGTLGDVATLYIGDQRMAGISGTPTAHTPNSANGYIDEVRVYNRAITATEAMADMTAVHDCVTPPALDHFVITHDSFGINCVPEPITVEAITNNGSTYTGYTGTVTLDTGSGKGTWTLAGGNGVFSDITANDGQASYTFALADNGIATFNLSYLEGVTPITITAQDGAAVGNAASLAFSPSGFTITANPLTDPTALPDNIGTQTAGTSFALHITAYGQTPADPVCGIIESYAGAKALKFWSDYNNPANGTKQVSIDGSVVTTTEAAATAQTVSFTAGQAQVTAGYPDVGLITINMKDDSTTDPNLPTGIRGGSNPFVVKPHHFSLSNFQCADGTANPAAVDHTGSPFCASGQNFSFTVAALNSAGALTPNFSKETPPESVRMSAPGWSASTAYVQGAYVLPSTFTGYTYEATTGGTSSGTEPIWPTAAGSTVTDGGVTWKAHSGYMPNLVSPAAGINKALTQSYTAFTNGSATGSLSWPEVGIIQLTPHIQDGDYLGAGDVAGTSTGNVGRFYPDHFTTATSNGVFANACSACATPFTYLGQGFTYSTAPTVLITANAISGTTTENYTGNYAFLGGPGVSLNYPIADSTQLDQTGTNPISVNVVNASLGRTDNTDGTLTFTLAGGATTDTYTYDRSLGQVAPFTADLSIQLNGVTDGEASANDLPKTLTPTGNLQRFGRAVLSDSYGRETEDQSIFFWTHYYDGTGFLVHGDDTGTAYSVAPADPSAPPLLTNPACSDPGTDAVQCSQVSVGGTAVSSGNVFTLSAPGTNNTGKLLYTLTVDPWLQFDWDGVDQGADGNKYDDNPAAFATFGIFRGDDRFLYWQEVE